MAQVLVEGEVVGLKLTRFVGNLTIKEKERSQS